MAIEIKATSRRALVKGAAWAAPVVATSAAVPAYAASPSKNTCTGTPKIDEFSWLYYNWGYNNGNQTTASPGTTTQTLLIHGGMSAANLPSDAVITSITSEMWIQERRDVTLGNGSPGSRGPGVYRPTHANSSVKNLGPSYQGTNAVYNSISAPKKTGRKVSPVFSSANAKVELVTNESFTWLLADNKTTYTSKAWGIKWTGDAAVANATLTTGANGCKSLPELFTTEFRAVYSSMLKGSGYHKTIYIDHIETITYTSDGQTKVVKIRTLGPEACSADYAWADFDGQTIDRCNDADGLIN